MRDTGALCAQELRPHCSQERLCDAGSGLQSSGDRLAGISACDLLVEFDQHIASDNLLNLVSTDAQK